MAIGIDLGAQGATIVFDDGSSTTVPTDLPRRRVMNDLVVRAGDPVPLVFREADGTITRQLAHDLYASEVARAMQEAGATPKPSGGRGVAVALPAWWTARATAMTRGAIQALAGRRIVTISDAEAAVRGFQARGGVLDDTVAVLDLGAQTSSAAILTGCRSSRPQLTGQAGVQASAAGDELDALILHHLIRSMADQGLTVDRDDAATVEAARAFVLDCRDARESLSIRSAVTLETDLAGADARLRLVRSEFEEIARPWARDVVAMLRTAIDSSGREIGSVLMVGGLARTPAVAQAISAELGLALIADEDPGHTVALGAMLAAGTADHRAGHGRGDRWRHGSPAVAAPAPAELLPVSLPAETPPVAPVETVIEESVAAAEPGVVEVPIVDVPVSEVRLPEVPAAAIGLPDVAPAAAPDVSLPPPPAPEPEEQVEQMVEEPLDLDDVIAVPTSPERAPEAVPTASYFSIPVPTTFAVETPDPVVETPDPVVEDAAEGAPTEAETVAAEAPVAAVAEEPVAPIPPPPPAAAAHTPPADLVPLIAEALPIAPPSAAEEIAPEVQSAETAEAEQAPEPEPSVEPVPDDEPLATSPLIAAAESLPFVEPEPPTPRRRANEALDASSGAESLESGWTPWPSATVEEPATEGPADETSAAAEDEAPVPPPPAWSVPGLPPPPPRAVVSAEPPPLRLPADLDVAPPTDETPLADAPIDSASIEDGPSEEPSSHRSTERRGRRGRRARRAAERDAAFETAAPETVDAVADDAVIDEAPVVASTVEPLAEPETGVAEAPAPPPAPSRRRGVRRSRRDLPPPLPEGFVPAADPAPADTIDLAPPVEPGSENVTTELVTAEAGPVAPAVEEPPAVDEPRAVVPPAPPWTPTPAPVPPPLDWLGSAPVGAPRPRRRGRRVQDPASWATDLPVTAPTSFGPAEPVAPALSPDETIQDVAESAETAEQRPTGGRRRAPHPFELGADQPFDATAEAPHLDGDEPTGEEPGRRRRRRITVLILVLIMGVGGAQLAWAERSGGSADDAQDRRLPVTRTTSPTTGAGPTTAPSPAILPTGSPVSSDSPPTTAPRRKATPAPPSTPGTTTPPPATQSPAAPTPTAPEPEPEPEPEPTTEPSPTPEPSESATPDIPIEVE